MNAHPSIVDQVASAILYEGYILYPYRPSLKNRQRWTFGGVYPRAYSQTHAGERCSIQTECLLEARPHAALDIRVRFLQLIDRRVGQFAPPLANWPAGREPAFHPVESLQVGPQVFHSWQEAVERDIRIAGLTLTELIEAPRRESFVFPQNRHFEPLPDDASTIVGVLVRQQAHLEGAVEVDAAVLGDDQFRLKVRIHNDTSVPDADVLSRDEAHMRSLVSTHTILNVRDGRFISLIDPPEPWRAAAAECQNDGAWPVLVGESGQTDTMLSAPIILYDYPQVAPESPGDLFDATEIDEILTLRIMTLADDERRQISSTEQHARALLQRTESLSDDTLAALHGTMRDWKPIAGGQPK